MPGTKEGIRNRARGIRAGLPESAITEKSKKIADSVLMVLDGHDPVMLYASKYPEVDTHPLIAALLSGGRKVVVPIIERETRGLRLSYLEDPAHLVPSTFSVPEPIGHEIPAGAGEIRAAVIPMLAFDASGHRIGYGAGYYDRFLSRNPSILKIGVAFSCQEVPCIPAEKNDIGMDLLVTERETRRFKYF